MTIPCLLMLLLAASAAGAATVTLEPIRDNSMFEDNGSASNGAGADLYSGLTGQYGARRALLDFDVAASIPAGSTINSATLQLVVIQVGPGATASDVYSLHRVTADWGEGGSNSLGGGGGATAQSSDATWTFALYNTTPWSTSGGDFVATASAAAATPTGGGVVIGSAQLAADVADMLANPASDHGWVLIGNETSPRSARKFHSRESTTASFRPLLIVDFTPPALQSVVLEPVKDNSMFENNGGGGNLSNGAGPELFSGLTGGFGPRRALLEFDIAAAIPAGSTIVSASLALNVDRAGPVSAGTQLSSLHRVTTEWGEGISGAGTSLNGFGSTAEAGVDATWTDAVSTVTPWAALGGDFDAGASVTFQTPTGGPVSIGSTAGMVSDVAGWLAAPSSNHGWILVGDESSGAENSARLWNSREATDPAKRPRLTIEYSPGSGGGARGAVPDGDDLPGTPFTLSLLAGGDVQFDWTSSCRSSDTDYAIYQGQIGSWYGHTPLICSTTGSLSYTAAIAAPRVYFLVVPHDGSEEGSYGDDSADVERPVGLSICHPQNIGAPVCP